MADSVLKTYKIPQSVLVLIHTDELEVLLIERVDMPAFWQSVTGARASMEESLFDTAAREVFEETGIRVVRDPGGQSLVDNEVPEASLLDWQLKNQYEIYPAWRSRYAPGVTVNTEYVFGLRVPRNIPVTLNPEEHTRYVWLPWQEAAGTCFSVANENAILQLPERMRRLCPLQQESVAVFYQNRYAIVDGTPGRSLVASAGKLLDRF